MKLRGKVEKEAVNWCRALKGVLSEFDDSLAMQSENHSINCRIAVKVSSPYMGLDNHAPDQWKLQDTEGNVLGVHDLVSLGDLGKSRELERRIDLFSHAGCGIYLNDLGHVML